MTSLHLINARLPDRPGTWQLTWADGHLTHWHPMTEAVAPDPATSVLDVGGDWISPGGVDLQINGALGLAFPDLAIAHLPTLEKICDALWQQGVDGFCPTLVTTSLENIHRALATIARFMEQRGDRAGKLLSNTAEILGVHLEGPFLNPEKRGAHPAEHLRSLTLDEVKRVLGDEGDRVTIMTLAPELNEAGNVIPYLVDLGITVSLGHSQATDAQANTAFDQGATMVTHAFNAMPGLHHRQPGLLGAAIAHPSVSCGVIADGVHVAPTMLDVLIRSGRGGRSPSPYPAGLFLVSDALSPLGLPDGRYPWDEREIEVTQGTARLPDGTLSGTTLPLLTGVENLVNWGICVAEDAIALATLAPRYAIHRASSPWEGPLHLLRWSMGISEASPATHLTWKRITP